MGEIIKFIKATERKRSIVVADGIDIPNINDGFKRGSYTRKTEDIKINDKQEIGSIAKIGGNERHTVGTKTGVKMASFKSEEQRATQHQETIEEVAGKIKTGETEFDESNDGREMELRYCCRYNIAM